MQSKKLTLRIDPSCLPKRVHVAIVRDFLEEMAKKHKLPIDEVLIGMYLNEVQIWRYSESSNQTWKKLETIA